MNLYAPNTRLGRFNLANTLSLLTVLLVVFHFGPGLLWVICFAALLAYTGVNRLLAARDERDAEAATAMNRSQARV